jgi:ABC-type transporter Mla maintaining outer membrane lipid asymmetry permease subunit MlaE
VDIIDHLVMPRILALVMVAPLVMAYAAWWACWPG